MLATKVIPLILYTTRKMDFANRRKNIYILALEYNLKNAILIYKYLPVLSAD